MNRRRFGTSLLATATLLALFVEPALAQTSSSVTEELIWDLNLNLLYIAVPITVLVEGILIYTVLKFRNNEDPLPTRENRRLEITWTIATAVVLLVVGVGSYQVLASPYVAGTTDAGEAVEEVEDPVEIEVISQRYSWRFQYTNVPANTSQPLGEDNQLQTTGTLYIPADRPVELEVTSTDWLHSFHVPALGLKQDAFPGQYNTILTKANEPGTYQLYCAEYCGFGHSTMLGQVEVVPEDEYEQTLANEQSS